MTFDTRTKLACVKELLEQNAITPAQAIALVKMATQVPTVTPEEADTSLARLKGLDTQSWSGEQARRGAAVGAVAAPVLSVAQKAIAGDPLFGRPTENAMKAFRTLPAGGGGKLRALAKVPVMAARNLAGASAIGAVGGGVMPLVKHEVEREAERGKLRRYVAQGDGSAPTQ